jgi:RNA-binding protein
VALYNRAMDKKTAKPAHAAATAGTKAAAASPDLSEKQRRYLRGLAHPLSPVIRLGKEGLTDSVAKETDRALHDHELIKVKAPGGDRDARDAVFAALAERTGSALVHRIGNVGVLYRPRPDLKRILIPD